MDIMARLDDEHRSVVEQLPPDLFDLSDLEAARQGFDGLIDALPAPEFPEGVEIVDHQIEGHDGTSVLVRIYLPPAVRPNSPAMYYIHGGGMVLADVSLSDDRCAAVADRLGVVVASVDYRLAPENPHPVPLEDCYSGLNWLMRHQDIYDIDTDRVAISGGSAGGGLAAGLALMCRDRGDLSPCFQLLTYPMLDDTNSTPSSHEITDLRFWNRSANLIAWAAYLGETGEADHYAAPSRAQDLSKLPPTLITVGDLDLFRDENISYAQRLSQAGVSTDLHLYSGAFHASNSFVPDSELSKRWLREELAALDRALNS